MFRRALGAAAALLGASASLAATAGTASAATAAASAAASSAARGAAAVACSTSQVIQVDGFAFHPSTVVAGQPSTATLTMQNCTTVQQTVGETWTGRYLSATGTGLPTGCPVLDPFHITGSLGPLALVSQSVAYSTFAGCTATALQVTVSLTGAGGVSLGQVSAVLTITPSPTA